MSVRYEREEEFLASAFKRVGGGLRDVQRATGTEKAQTMQTAIDALDKAGDAVQGVRVPAPVVDVALVSNVGAWSQVGPVSDVTVGWAAVTVGADGDPIAVTEYEVWVGDSPTASTVMLEATVQIPAGLSRSVRVRAVTAAGVPGDLSVPLTVLGAAPTAGAVAPSAPVLATGYGDVSAFWDGAYTAPAAGAHSVWVEARIAGKLDPLTPATAWERQGPALTGRGSTLIRLGEVGDTLDVRIVAYDQLGRETGISAVASIEIASIPGASLTLGSIEVDHLSPNVGETLNLAANGSIILQAGRLDELSSGIAGVTDDVANVDAKATSAEVAAAAAASAAAIADGKALVAQIQAQEVADGLAQQQAVFVVIPTGAEVRAVDASSVTRIEPEEISMLQGGVKLFRVKDSQVIANEIVANRAQVAHHVFEKFGSDRTVIRLL